ncbi:response regulator transcription factor [Culicoidibacter larvae]|uniref:Response regulator transcription factor n=1 Tax=Culicoidibacter larvae TaxID=2579976 RepID=A0A5R8Q817_9FIRM|nr:response regulator transcription factor [Culicoidibacter larvae]TLG71245.1 response regulator transcription factor [Culicoidibacter larvae]
MTKILFVDDDERYQTVIKELLEVEGYTVVTAMNVASGLELYKNSKFDLVISDLKMETFDGLQFLQMIRKYNKQAKVIILTNSESPRDELRGLDLEASEYINKTTEIDIMLKRIERVLMMDVDAQPKREILRSNFEDLSLDLRNFRVKKNDVEYNLTQTEFNVLAYLMKNKNEVVSRETILEAVWNVSGTLGDIRAVDTYVKRIRSKLRISSIFTVRGVGYEWVEK